MEFKQNNTNLSLKFGQALKENDLLLYVLSDREPSSLELAVDKNISLSHLWVLIKDELHMEGEKIANEHCSLYIDPCLTIDTDNEHHLCEVQASLINDGPPLNDFEQSLAINGLTNGAQLTMRAGSVAPKNHVRLKVFRIIEKTHKPAEASMNSVFSPTDSSLVVILRTGPNDSCLFQFTLVRSFKPSSWKDDLSCH